MYRQMAIFDVRIMAELFAEVVPRTAENFCALCTGEKMGKSGKPLYNKGQKFRRVIPGFKLQSRDFSRNAGTSGESESIPGEKFTAEDTRQESQTEPEIPKKRKKPSEWGRREWASVFLIVFAWTISIMAIYTQLNMPKSVDAYIVKKRRIYRQALDKRREFLNEQLAKGVGDEAAIRHELDCIERQLEEKKEIA